jgi:putative membrane protein
MRLILTTAVASLAIITAACNNTADDTADANMSDDMAMNDMAMNDMAMNDMNMANGMAMAPMAAADFASAVAATDMYEIASGKLAQTMATMDECKTFGAMLVTDHNKSTADLKAAAGAASPPVMVPAAMPADMQAKLDALKAAKGAAFDKLFIEQQKEVHQKALATLQSYSSGGDVPSLKAFAAKGAPMVQGHLDKLNAMKM